MPIVTRSIGKKRHNKPADTTYVVADTVSGEHAETYSSSHLTTPGCLVTEAYTATTSSELKDTAPMTPSHSAQAQTDREKQTAYRAFSLPVPSGNKKPETTSCVHPLPEPSGGVSPLTASCAHSLPVPSKGASLKPADIYTLPVPSGSTCPPTAVVVPPEPEPSQGLSRAHSQAARRQGSTKSKAKSIEIARTKQRLLELKIELEAARLAALEADSEESDDDSFVYSETSRVDEWLDNHQEKEQHKRQAIVPHDKPLKLEEPKNIYQPLKIEKSFKEEKSWQIPSSQSKPAGAQSDFSLMTAAITKAIKAAPRPKFVELPVFHGSHQEWLPFKAAYFETEQSFSIVENMNRLRRNLKGRAREAVENLLVNGATPTDVMNSLEARFGRPESIAKLEIEKLRTLPRLTDAPRDICIFASKVTNAVTSLRALNCIFYLYNPEVTTTMVEKLTPTLRYKYYEFAAGQPKDEPDLLKFEQFMKKEAELCGPFAQPENITVRPHVQSSQQQHSQKIHTITEKELSQKCPVCDEAGHTATDCNAFKEADENSRWDIAKARRLCFRCLRYRNKTHSCRMIMCSINSCKYFHHRMLHFIKKTDKAEDSENEGSKEEINSVWAASGKEQKSYLKIIPVQASGPKGTVDTFALLDDGSTVTLIDASIADTIGARGPVDLLHIEAFNKMKRVETKSRRVNITLKGFNDREYQIQARTVKNLKVSSQDVSSKQLQECAHLQDISKDIIYEKAKPKILIGQDNWHLLLSSTTRRGDKNQPVASLTPLGWVLHGTHIRTLERNSDFVHHITEKAGDIDNVKDATKRYSSVKTPRDSLKSLNSIMKIERVPWLEKSCTVQTVPQNHAKPLQKKKTQKHNNRRNKSPKFCKKENSWPTVTPPATKATKTAGAEKTIDGKQKSTETHCAAKGKVQNRKTKTEIRKDWQNAEKREPQGTDRMLQAVKTDQTANLPRHHPTDKLLATLSTEVEYTVAQKLADVIWTRWLKRYLTELQHRREPFGEEPDVRIEISTHGSNASSNMWKHRNRTLQTPGTNLVPVREDVVQAPGQDATALHGGSNVQDDYMNIRE